jgi:hypothetical protein
MDCVELEFGLHRREADGYMVELRVNRPDSDAPRDLISRLPADRLDIESFHKRKFEIDAYGRQLFEGVFADPKALVA